MKEKEKSLSIGQYAGYGLSIILLVSGLVWLLSSCDQEGLPEGKKRSGKRIAISAHIAGVTERTADDNTRWSGTEAEAITETVPIGNGLLLDMHLEPVPASQLRATTPLATGKKYRVIALDGNNHTYVSHGDFTVGLADPEATFEVIQGETYVFICVSLNSTSLPTTNHLASGETPDFSNISGAVDLLYDQITKTITSEGDATLSFTLVHKFSEITLVVDCNFDGDGITSVAPDRLRLDSLYNANTMDWAGTVTQGTREYNDLNPFTFPNNTAGSKIWTSAPKTLFRGNTGSFGIVVTAYAVNLSGYGSLPKRNMTVPFTNKPLAPGKKYKLTLKFREPKFAASNIYWDNTAQKLTFAPYSETPSLVPENQYQGIFFKFGSLIGMSPKDNGNSSTTPLFVPPTRSGGYGTWYITSADGSLTTAGLPSELADSPVYNHINENGTLWTGTNYDAIPYAIGGVVRTTPDESYSDRYVIDMPADSLAEFKGDICKYINPLYRLPMAYEFGSFGTAQWDPNPNIGWTKVGTPWDLVTSDQADGTYINTNNTGAKYGWTENFFPASGYRSAVWEVHEAGSSGRYWSGSIEGSGEPNRTNVYCLYFTSIQMNATSSVGRKNGFPVRCILQE